MPDEEAPPTKTQIESMWRDLIAGVISREDAHLWAVPWVEERWSEVDSLLTNALQSLHGFDMTYDVGQPNILRHGPGDAYVHSDADIAASLERWLLRCDLEEDIDHP